MTNKREDCKIHVIGRDKLFVKGLLAKGIELAILCYIIIPSKDFTESPVKKTFWKMHD